MSSLLFNNTLLLMTRRCGQLMKSKWMMSSSSPNRIVTTKDGSVIVAWHPVNPFPYEASSPIPNSTTMMTTNQSGHDHKRDATSTKLKINYVDDMKELYHKKSERLVRRDLMRLTWTTKHRWFIRQGYRKEAARKNPREKPFL